MDFIFMFHDVSLCFFMVLDVCPPSALLLLTPSPFGRRWHLAVRAPYVAAWQTAASTFDIFDEVTENVRASRCCQVSGWRPMPSWSLNDRVDLKPLSGVKDLHTKRKCLETRGEKAEKSRKNRKISKSLSLPMSCPSAGLHRKRIALSQYGFPALS